MQLKWFTFWFILIISFLIFGTALVFGVTGYTYNWQVKKIEKTGLIVLQSQPSYAQIKLNGTILERQTPARISYLRQGRYDLEVSKDGYRSWVKTINVLAEVSSLEKAILFLYSPIKTDLESKSMNPAIFELKNKDLKFENSEIWYKDKLVSRFSFPVEAATISPERDYIVFKVKDELRVILTDGTNDNHLYRLGSTEAQFTFKDEETLLINERNSFYSLRVI